MDQNEIRRSAKLLMKAHGEDAALHAEKMADAKLESGDLNRSAYWKQIAKMIVKMSANKREKEQ